MLISHLDICFMNSFCFSASFLFSCHPLTSVLNVGCLVGTGNALLAMSFIAQINSCSFIFNRKHLEIRIWTFLLNHSGD